MARLKVWGGMIMTQRGQRRAAIATTSQKEAAQILQMSLHEFRNYWCETWNPAELAAALSQPGIVFEALDIHSDEYSPSQQ